MSKKHLNPDSDRPGSKNVQPELVDKFFEVFIDSIDYVIYIVDRDLRFVLVNESLKKIGRTLNVRVNDLIGNRIQDKFPFLEERIINEYRQILKSGEIIIKEEETTDVNGRLLFTESRKIPIFEKDKVKYIVTMVKNITEKYRIQQALKESEEKYRLLVENVNAHISIIEADGNVLYANKLAAGLHNTTPEKVIGKNLSEFFPPEIFQFQIKKIRQVIENGVEYYDRVRITTDNEDKWYETNIQPYKDHRRKTVAALVIAIDITSQMELEEARRVSEYRYQALVESIRADIAVFDRDGVFLFNNTHGARSLGLPLDELVGKKLTDFFPAEAAGQYLNNIRNVIDSGKSHHEQVYTEVGGEWKWFDIDIQPYRENEHSHPAALVVALDITSQRKAVEALRQSEERFRLQFEYLPVSTYIWEYRDNTFFLKDYNRAAEDLTENGIGKFLGLKVDQVHGDRPDIIEDLNKCVRKKDRFTREMPFTMKVSGKKFYFEVYYVYIPDNLVLVHTIDITKRKQDERILKETRDELEKSVKIRTHELAEANEALELERESLSQKNIALREVLNQIEEGKRQTAMQVQTNINRIVIPILKSLQNKVPESLEKYIELLDNSLKDIAAPLLSTLETKSAYLTPREMEICNMVKNGMTCKEIADTLNTSVQTVLKQRSQIRKKLGINGKKTNLSSYLKSLG